MYLVFENWRNILGLVLLRVTCVVVPTKWMTNCPALAFLLGVRCTGGHDHSKLEGSKRTAQASKYPTSLVNAILNTVKKVKSRLTDTNHARDPDHFMIPEILRQTEDEISLVCNRKQMSIYDMQPPPQISADQILVRRTVDRRTGVVIAEENVHDLTAEEQTRKLLGQVPKEILTIFFYWDGNRVSPSANTVRATKGKSQYLTLTDDLFNMYCNDPKLIPRSTYRKNVGEGVRTITHELTLLLWVQIGLESLLLMSRLQSDKMFKWHMVRSPRSAM